MSGGLLFPQVPTVSHIFYTADDSGDDVPGSTVQVGLDRLGNSDHTARLELCH